MTKSTLHPISAEHFHAVDAATCQQTINESDVDYSIVMGATFTIHHGTRCGAPIVIVENHDQRPGELSGIWYSEN